MNRLVVICSMSSSGKTNYEDDKFFKIKEFFVNSWKIEEYYESIQNEQFFNSIEDYLDSTENMKEIEKKERIDSKYYFAGGSSRFMFGYKTNEVIKILTTSIRSVKDLVPYIDGTIGERSDVINRLFNVFEEGDVTKTSLVSQYEANEMAFKLGSKLVENLYGALKNESNSAMDGWMLEMWFFSKLKKDGLNVYDKFGNPVNWPSCKVLNFDPQHPEIQDSPIWLKPIKWNQGGYDAVYVDKEKGHVRFVQITKGKEHSFKIQYFYNCLIKFRDLFETKILEIYFLVTKDVISDFKIPISKIEGNGNLIEFGWKKNKEIDEVKIRWIEGMNL